MHKALGDALSLKKTSAWQAGQMISWAGRGEAASLCKTGVSFCGGLHPENAVPDGALGGGWTERSQRPPWTSGHPAAPAGPHG